VTFELGLDGPIDVAASLEVFRRSGDDLLDRWDGTHLCRTVRVNGRPVAFAAQVARALDPPTLAISVEDGADQDAIKAAIIHSLPPLPSEFTRLCRTDPLIGRLAKLHRGFRPVLHPDLLVALVRCISAQQVNLRWAATGRRRLAEKFGERHEIAGQFVYSLSAERLARLEIADIRALQFATRKSEYIINAARAIAEGALDFAELVAMPDDEVIARITAVRGLGLWSAEWILARTLGRPRVSAADLGVRKAVGKAYFTLAAPRGLGRPLGGRMPSPEEVREATTHWGAAANFVQELILHAQHLKTLEPGVT
jgi:DNA-3-methyladenine glycosylase II